MLYIKIDPSSRDTHCKTGVSGTPRPLKRIVGMLYIRIDPTHITVLHLLSELYKSAETTLTALLRPPCAWVKSHMSVTLLQCFYVFRHCLRFFWNFG